MLFGYESNYDVSMFMIQLVNVDFEQLICLDVFGLVDLFEND